jgi:hypothetical protein
MGKWTIWVPDNPHMRAMGLHDDRDEAIAYAQHDRRPRAP